jgi:cell division protein FtsB
MARRNYLKTDTTFRAAWIKRLLIAGGIIGGIVFLWSLIVGEMGVIKYYRMSVHARALRSEIDRLKKDNARLSKEVSALKTDPAFLERMARDKIGLARPGEVVYYYGESSK